ncbi:MAG TPA: hypothetical protein VH025_09610 [Solirubrobacteraceae bacterium]|jgi:hypothetical protein|nr:hypothetical protein [Solirubrobacteraceae bacterium]
MTTPRKQHYTLASALLAAAIAIAAFAMSASAASPLKITNCNKAASSPKLLTLTCGDGNTVLKGMTWSNFGSGTASGKGTFVTNTCEPNCAQGKDVSYAVSVKAEGKKQCKGATVYAKLSLSYPGTRKPPPSEPRKWFFRCPS